MNQHKHGRPAHDNPFITISHDAGASGETIVQQLVERLSQIDPA